MIFFPFSTNMIPTIDEFSCHRLGAGIINIFDNNCITTDGSSVWAQDLKVTGDPSPLWHYSRP